jgi:hypothetical protein
MQTVIETPTYLRHAKDAGLSQEEMALISETLADNPTAGVVIPGTGGARKVRFPGKGKGKSGGYRTIHFYAADDVPVFLLALINKGERDDITKAEANALRTLLGRLPDAYREGMREKIRQMRGR